VGLKDWSKDPAFKGLADSGMRLRRLSWHCANFKCIECDGKIHYKFKKEFRGVRDGKFYGLYRNAMSGEMEGEQLFEDYVWDTEFESVQLDGGQSQNPINTPEGSTCQCHHCHGRPGYKEWKARGGKPKNVFDVPRGSYAKNEMADEQREQLR